MAAEAIFLKRKIHESENLKEEFMIFRKIKTIFASLALAFLLLSSGAIGNSVMAASGNASGQDDRWWEHRRPNREERERFRREQREEFRRIREQDRQRRLRYRMDNRIRTVGFFDRNGNYHRVGYYDRWGYFHRD
jgi:hypothetical protein